MEKWEAGCRTLRLHRTAVQRSREQITRLYEHGADQARVGEYLRRWLRWCESGIERLSECAAVMGLRAWLRMVAGGLPATGGIGLPKAVDSPCGASTLRES